MSRDRRWLELRARPAPGDAGTGDSEAEEGLVAEALLALGGRAVEERDGWHLTHLEEPRDPAGFLEEARALVAGLAGRPVEVEARWQAHEDWAESWKRGLDTRRVTPRLVVTPSWIPYHPREGERVLVLDPGMAFGTAEHGTTRGALRLLDRSVAEGDRVLDVGAGSGILSIAAVLLGAAVGTAVEGDPLACEAMAENLERNGVADRVEVVEAWADEASLAALGPRDGCVANIEWRLLEPLVPGLVAAVRPGGWLVLSGILADQRTDAEVRAREVGLDLVDRDEDGEWRSLLLRRPAHG